MNMRALEAWGGYDIRLIRDKPLPIVVTDALVLESRLSKIVLMLSSGFAFQCAQGPGDVLVRVTAVGICASDVKMYKGGEFFWGKGV